MIQQEYGWSDEQILDMPMCRVTQIKEVIEERHAEDRRAQIDDYEAMVKTICRFVAATRPGDHGRALLREADRIRFRERDDHAEGPPPGSFEALMEMFGG